eukprot:m.640048 g.640048  ORF g.640048 m.640048 type:complete len:84 (+) comp22619_c0_seq10:1883-2134(+)
MGSSTGEFKPPNSHGITGLAKLQSCGVELQSPTSLQQRATRVPSTVFKVIQATPCNVLMQMPQRMLALNPFAQLGPTCVLCER